MRLSVRILGLGKGKADRRATRLAGEAARIASPSPVAPPSPVATEPSR